MAKSGNDKATQKFSETQCNLKMGVTMPDLAMEGRTTHATEQLEPSKWEDCDLLSTG